jgi:bla regulator protein BlaR1
MRSFTEIFSSLSGPMGWTLVNSLWQALAVITLVVIALRFVSPKASRVRYGIACGGMLLILIMNAFTFCYLMDSAESSTATSISFYDLSAETSTNSITPFSIPATISAIRGIIDSNIPAIIMCWIAGALLFSLRIVSGWWYISQLKTEATQLSDEWNERLQNLAHQLQINRVILLAQSTRIHSPLVIGFLKPIILIPAGILSGLSIEQIETIFIHELAHIRRHDYIINLAQTFVEAIFFFNPFVWFLSNIIRREREYCCDDTVVTKHGSSLAYAHALAQLEEVRLTRSGIALSLAENKNQLLNRIKRIMEKSAKNYSSKDRVIPALLLVIGLMCASWLTITTDTANAKEEAIKSNDAIAQDTVIKSNKTTYHSRQTITTIDENGQPHETVVEEYSGDDGDLVPVIANIPSIDVMPMIQGIQGVPVMPSMDVFPNIPDVMLPPMFNMSFSLDTVPGAGLSYRVRDDNWDAFSAEFEKKFREQFSDFYKTHEKDLDKMLKEMEEKFAGRFDVDLMDKMRNDFWADSREWEHAAAGMNEEEMKEAREEAMRAQENLLAQQQEFQQNIQQNQREIIEQQLELQAQQMKEMEVDMKALERKTQFFEKELKEELVKDGYLKKDDKINTINLREDGPMEINGVSVKEVHREKYNQLHNKYFKQRGNYRYVE